MLGTIVLTIIVVAIIWVIYVEYKNAQKYKKQREEKRNLRRTPPTTATVEEPLKKKEEPKPEPLKEEVVVTPKKVEIKPEPVPEPEVILEEPKVEEKVEVEVTVAKELPPCDYPPFDHARTVVNLGLSEEEAKEFVGELINQIDTQLPLIKQELETGDFHKLERLTHSIKGSATNLGTGGVSDLLVDFNTYLKQGTDMEIVQNYFACLENYTQQLKEQYS